MGLLGRQKSASEWVRLAAETDFVHSLEVNHAGRTYALLRSEGHVYCTQGSCSHEYSPLAAGMIAENAVYCEKHGSRFNLLNGEVLSPPACENIKVYPVEIRNGEVWVKI